MSCLRDEIWDRQKGDWRILEPHEQDQFYKKIRKHLKEIYNYDLSIEEIKEKISKSPDIELIKL